MSWGNPFKSAWNSATDAAKQTAAQIATGAKQVGAIVVKAADTAADKAAAAAQWAKDTTAKVAKDVDQKVAQVTKAMQQAPAQVAKAVQQKAAPAVAAVKNVAAVTANNVKQTFSNVKKTFDSLSTTQKVILACPTLAPLSPFLSAPTAGVAAARLSFALDTGKDIIDLVKFGKDLGLMTRAGILAGRYGPDTRSLALGKHLVRAGIKLSPLEIVLDIAVGGVIGGLDSAGRNLDRADLSNADKVGRVAFGAGKGAVKGAAPAVIGAGIGALVGSVVPGPGTVAGAVIGAKVGALLGIAVGPLTDGLVDKILPMRYEENVGHFTDQTYKKAATLAGNAAREVSKASTAVKGALLGTVNMVKGWHF